MNKLNMLTAMALASLILALGAVHGLGMFPRLTEALASSSGAPATVISFEENASDAIHASPDVIAVAPTAEP